MRSEVTGDAETALEAAAVALPSSGNEGTGVEDRSDVPARRVLLHVLIHQLEVEVQVGDRVPADVRADQVSEGVGRNLAGADGTSWREHRPALVAPVDSTDRGLEIGVEGRGPVMLQQAGDRPCAWGGPLIGQRIEVSVRHVHRLTIAVDLPVLTILGVRQTRIPDGVLGVGAGEQNVVTRAERRQVNLHAGVDAPTDLALARGAASRAGGYTGSDSAGVRAEVAVIPDVDIVDHAGDLRLAPSLLDMQRADDVGPTLTAIGRGTRNTARKGPGAQVIRVTSGADQVGAAAGGAVRALALRSEGRREAAAERGGIGKQDWLVKALLVRREEVVPVVAAADERIERLRLTSGDASPGHIACVDVSEGATWTIQTATEVGVKIHMPNQWAVGRVRRKIETEVGADVPTLRVAIERCVLLVRQDNRFAT